MSVKYDVLIIGGGPAGLSAAVNLRARNKSVLVLGNQEHSLKLLKAPLVDNYLGLGGISGREMAERFLSHAVDSGAEIINARVNQIYPLKESFQVITDKNTMFEGSALILAVGTTTVASLEREAELLGRGVSYCATCDGMLYRDKEVVVLGYSPQGEEEANFLADVCRKVSYLPFYRDTGFLKENIAVIAGKPRRIIGQDKVEGIELSSGDISCNAVFIARDAIPLEQLLPGLKQEGRFIGVDRLMRTNLQGVFAAGDCTGLPHQIAKAVGEGLTAALSAAKYLEEKQKG